MLWCRSSFRKGARCFLVSLWSLGVNRQWTQEDHASDIVLQWRRLTIGLLMHALCTLTACIKSWMINYKKESVENEKSPRWMVCCKHKHLVFSRVKTKAAFFMITQSCHLTVWQLVMQMCVSKRCSPQLNPRGMHWVIRSHWSLLPLSRMRQWDGVP